MIEVEEGEVAVDVCPECGGLWLDRGELEQKGAQMPTHLVAISPKEERTCPRCVEPLALFRGELLELDTCERCGGLYLDAGEIEVLMAARRLERPAVEEEGPEASPPAEPPTAGLRFRCDFCHRQFPVREQVVGELATACPPCAKRLDVRHDPEARRAQELQRSNERGSSTDLPDDSGGSVAGLVAYEVADIAIDGLFSALFDLF